MTAVRCCGVLELETKFHSKVRNHGEVPYKSLLLVESGYYRFQIWDTMLTFANLRLTFDSSSMVYWGASWEANIPWLVSSPDTQHQHPLPGPQPSQEQLDTLSPLARSCMEVRGRSGRSNHLFSCIKHFWEKWEKFNYKLVKNILTENKEIGLHQLD